MALCSTYPLETDLNSAIEKMKKYTSEKKALSIGLLGNAAELIPQIEKLSFQPHLVTDQTSAHDPLLGYSNDSSES